MLSIFHPLGWVRATLRATDDSLLEIQNSTASVIVGMVMILAGTRLYSRTPDAYQMFEVLSPMVWGLLYAGAGAAHIVLLKLRLGRWRRWVLLFKMVLWVFLATGLLKGVGWFVPAVYIYFLFAIVALRGYVKLTVDGDRDG